MQKATSAFFILLLLSCIVIVHELGHFIACKIFSVRTPVFSLGFGPPLAQKTIGKTTFQIALLPLGGYVSMSQQDLAALHYWQKIIIILAGIFNNLVTAYLLLIILFSSQPQLYATIFGQTIHTGVAAIRYASNAFFLLIKQTLYAIIRLKPIERPINVIKQLQETGQISITHFIMFFIAIISIELAIFNLLPLPMLDGGQLWRYTLQALLGNNSNTLIMHLIYVLLLVLAVIYFNRRKKIT